MMISELIILIKYHFKASFGLNSVLWQGDFDIPLLTEDLNQREGIQILM